MRRIGPIRRVRIVGLLLLLAFASTSARASGDDLEDLRAEGRSFYERKQYRQALEQFKRSLKAHETILGREAIDTGYQHAWLGHCYRQLGQPAKAVECYQRNLAICRKQLDEPNHDEIIWAHHNLASQQFAVRDFASAVEHYQQSTALAKSRIDENRDKFAPRAFWGLTGAGGCYTYLGQLVKAEECYQQALQTAEKHFRPDSGFVADAHYQIGHFLDFHLGQTEQAEHHLAAALQVLDKPNTTERRLLADTLCALGNVKLRLKQKDQGRKHLERAVEILDRQGDNPALHTQVLLNFIKNLIETQEYQRAEPIARRTLQACRTWYGEKHHQTQDAAISLGHVCLKLEKYEEAEQLLAGAQMFFEKQTSFHLCKH